MNLCDLTYGLQYVQFLFMFLLGKPFENPQGKSIFIVCACAIEVSVACACVFATKTMAVQIFRSTKMANFGGIFFFCMENAATGTGCCIFNFFVIFNVILMVCHDVRFANPCDVLKYCIFTE